jgi:hypothetical protein
VRIQAPDLRADHPNAFPELGGSLVVRVAGCESSGGFPNLLPANPVLIGGSRALNPGYVKKPQNGKFLTSAGNTWGWLGGGTESSRFRHQARPVFRGYLRQRVEGGGRQSLIRWPVRGLFALSKPMTSGAALFASQLCPCCWSCHFGFRREPCDRARLGATGHALRDGLLTADPSRTRVTPSCDVHTPTSSPEKGLGQEARRPPRRAGFLASGGQL